jgi:hypothetical protein
VTEPAYCVYGMRVTGLPAGLPMLGDVVPWPTVNIVNGAPPAAGGEQVVGSDRAEVPLPMGRRLVILRTGEARFHGPPLPPDELVHPYLGLPASLWSRWRGQECFHAGAFVAGDRAWVVRGEREAGKSTLLAALAARGVPVLADDIVIVDAGQVLAGPRCIDLREQIPGLPGIEQRSWEGSRCRLSLPSVPPSVPLGGWIFLEWGGEPARERLDARSVLSRVAAGRAWPALGTDDRAVLDVATRPAWVLTRPHLWLGLPDMVDQLLDLVGDSPGVPPVTAH